MIYKINKSCGIPARRDSIPSGCRHGVAQAEACGSGPLYDAPGPRYLYENPWIGNIVLRR